MKRFLKILSITFSLFVLLPSCKHKHHDNAEQCKTECAERKNCKGEKCDEKKKCTKEKACSRKAGDCKGKKCSGKKDDKSKSSVESKDSISASASTDSVVTMDPFKTAKYICPMKCDGGYSDKPGKCKVCGMDLRERK